MLYGTNAWEVNNSYARGFTMTCAACGTGHMIKVLPILTNIVEDECTTRPYTMYVIIECEACEQVVHVLPDGTSKIVRRSKKHCDATE